jgi:ribosomal protein L11 methyltransferase
VVGVDIDQQAILSSKYNAELNNICASFMLPEQLDKNERFDVVLANILATPLKELAPLLRNYTAQNLLLSGILEQQADEVINVYKQYFTKVEQKNTNGWIMLCFRL